MTPEQWLERRARCYDHHLGLWAVHLIWAQEFLAALRNGLVGSWDEVPQRYRPAAELLVAEEREHRRLVVDSDGKVRSATRDEREDFVVGSDGVAVLGITGPLTKGQGKIGTSSVAARRAVRSLAADDSVRGIMVVVDSPGGNVAGIDELAEDIRIAAGRKEVRAHIDDLGASAAYWIVQGARRISAGRTAQVGSIGTMAMLVDRSKQAEMEGLKVHVVSTGALKGAGAPGTPITDEVIAEVRRRVEATNAHFLEAVSRSRGLRGAALERVATGEVWVGEEARALGLVDVIGRLDEQIDDLRAAVANVQPRPGRGRMIKADEIRLRLLSADLGLSRSRNRNS